MRKLAGMAMLAGSMLVTWGCGEEKPAPRPTDESMRATITAAVAEEVARRLGEPEEEATAEPIILPSATPTQYRPYGNIAAPTPTVPAWMTRLNANGPPARHPGSGGPPDEWIKLLANLKIAEQDDTVEYVRDDWGGWMDEDEDCQDTRAEVLAAESTRPVTYRGADECVVDEGEWRDRWTGETFTAARDLDVDHHVPLAHAHRSSAAGWTTERKRQYANDTELPDALNAMYSNMNRQKGADGPDEWRPPDRTSWCDYARGWIAVKTKWELTITPRELSALTEMLEGCAR